MSGREHWAWMGVVEEDEEEKEERRRRGRRGGGEGGEETTYIKSNHPYLAGGEKRCFC